ncbi:MAG: ribbon-helix-helix domain-containing protein [Actinomycetota bacterium]|nr:ribbon-helix-helix domain-containing protein [Actinomycetota bacterium]
MTTLSFRVDEKLVTELDRLSTETGATRSALLNRALRELLYRAACERDARAYERQPLSTDELISPSAQVWPEGDDAAW